jgi:hypothetical protein
VRASLQKLWQSGAPTWQIVLPKLQSLFLTIWSLLLVSEFGNDLAEDCLPNPTPTPEVPHPTPSHTGWGTLSTNLRWFGMVGGILRCLGQAPPHPTPSHTGWGTL